MTATQLVPIEAFGKGKRLIYNKDLTAEQAIAAFTRKLGRPPAMISAGEEGSPVWHVGPLAEGE